MAENKTKQTDEGVDAFLNSIVPERKRADAFELLEIFEKATGFKAKMWGDSIVGFGSYHYVYESGREGDSPLTGFSPRKQNLTLYIMSGFDNHTRLLSELGKHKTSKVCIYFNKVENIDVKILSKIIKNSISQMIESNPSYSFTLE